ncbi:MAG: sugar transferase [Deltaproteobacteria bacterium]|nr:sugar transferase [Deltaproteobacteria bacterium]
MLRQRAKLVENALIITDVGVTVGVFFAAYVLRNSLFRGLDRLFPLEHYLYMLLVIAPVWAFTFKYMGVYRSFRTTPIVSEIKELIKVTFVCGMILGFAIFLFKFQLVASRLFIAIFLTLDFLALILVRVSIRLVSRWVRKSGYNFRNMIIVGDDRRAVEFARMAEQTRWWGYRVTGFIGIDQNSLNNNIAPYKFLGVIEDIERVVSSSVVDEVVFLVNRKTLDTLEETFLFLEDVGINTRVAVNFFPNVIARVSITSLNDIPLLSFSTRPSDDGSLMVKSLIDKLASLVLLAGLCPFFLLIALVIKLDSKGRVIYTQTRCGMNGRRFTLYKFRSMVAGAHKMKRDIQDLNEMDGPVFKIKDDPRVTRVGKLLRKTSIDELPQLLNVLKGDMSLVGPRAPLPEEVAQYERWQRRRLSMKPGLTCLWQINGRNKVDFLKWMAMDLEYIDNWNLKLDFKILLKTIPAVILGKGW